jgi:hypothetical protein
VPGESGDAAPASSTTEEPIRNEHFRIAIERPFSVTTTGRTPQKFREKTCAGDERGETQAAPIYVVQADFSFV